MKPAVFDYDSPPGSWADAIEHSSISEREYTPAARPDGEPSPGLVIPFHDNLNSTGGQHDHARR